MEKVDFKKIFPRLRFKNLFAQLTLNDWFVSEMGRACSFSSASIWPPGSSWAPPSGHIPQCSTTRDCQVTSRTWDLNHTVHLQCVVNVTFVCFQIYGLLYGQTGLCLVLEPDCASKAANQGRFWKTSTRLCVCVSGQFMCVCHYPHDFFCLILLLPLFTCLPGWRSPVGRLYLWWCLSWWEPA